MFSASPPPKRKTGPARAELAIGDGNELAATEEGAGVVLALHVAIGHLHMLGADEMEAVVIAVHAVVDANAVKLHERALDDAHRVVGAGLEKDVADGEVSALVEEQVVRPVVAAAAGGRRDAAAGAMELSALSINGAGAFDGDVIGFHGEDETDIAVAERGIAGERDAVGRVVLFAVG